MQSANPSPLTPSRSMLPEIRREFLTRVMEGKAIERVSIKAADAQLAYDFGAADDKVRGMKRRLNWRGRGEAGGVALH